jgi:hypothetical protein
MKRTGLTLFLPLVFILSCATTPVKPDFDFTAQASFSEEPAPQAITSSEEEEFDPASISEEKYAAAKADIQGLIVDLNRIMRARNYNAWLSHLDASYYRHISSQGFLEEKTEELYKRDQIVATNSGKDPRNVQKRILKTPRDYFDNVVVPSRSNDRVDDIAFVSIDHVRAYTLDSRGQRLILYELATSGDHQWKIIN